MMLDRLCSGIWQRLGFTMDGILRDSEWLQDRFVSHRVFNLLEHEWTH